MRVEIILTSVGHDLKTSGEEFILSCGPGWQNKLIEIQRENGIKSILISWHVSSKLKMFMFVICAEIVQYNCPILLEW